MARFPLMQSIQRWKSSRAQREGEWQSHSLYWEFRRRARELDFLRIRAEFSGRSRWQEETRSVADLFRLLRSIVRTILLTIVLTAGIESLSQVVLRIWPPDTESLYWPSFLTALFPVLNTGSFDDASVVSYLATLVQIAAVFLGLYFTAITFVVNAYVSNGAPHSVRRLLVEELARSKYIDLMSFFGAFVALLLFQATFVSTPGFLSIVLTVLLGITSILGFVVLGVQSFALLQPVSLATQLLEGVDRWMRAGAPDGNRWRDPSVQAYYRKQAEAKLSALRELTVFILQSPRVSTNDAVRVADSALWLFARSVSEKRRIPTKSEWFPRKMRFRSWLVAPELSLSQFINIGYDAERELAPDFNWIESVAKDVLRDTLAELCSEDSVQSCAQVVERTHQTLRRITRSLAVQDALDLDSEVTDLLSQQKAARIIKQADLDTASNWVSSTLELNEISYLGTTSACLGFNDALSALTLGEFRSSIASIKWNNPRSIYEVNLPTSVLPVLEDLSEKLRFESDIEGAVQTPAWYWEQQIARSFAGFLFRSVEAVTTRMAFVFGDTTKKLVSDDQLILAAQSIVRGLEASDRASHMITLARDRVGELETLRRLKEEPWPVTDWTIPERRIESLRRLLLRQLALCTPELSKSVSPKGLHPDFFGMSYHLLGNSCSQSLLEGDVELFKDLFPAFFASAHAAKIRLFTETEDTQHQPSRTMVLSEPIADLLTLSGLARLYSELLVNDAWGVVVGEWNRYFTEVKLPELEALVFAAINQERKSIPLLGQWEGVRHGWKARLLSKLREMDLLNAYPNVTGFALPLKKHSSTTINAAISGGWDMVDPVDVFVVEYLAQRPGATPLMLTKDQKRFQKLLLRQSQP